MSRGKNQRSELVTVDKDKSVYTPTRGVYRGPNQPMVDYETAKKIPHEFFPDELTQTIFTEIVRSGYQLSCDTLTNRLFWQKEWTTCPICGSKPDYVEGVWVHYAEQ